jgi:hypothetical protein
MAHQECEADTNPHFLNDELLEWRLLMALQPLFTSDVGWKQSPLQGGTENDAEAIKSANALGFFIDELKYLPVSEPENSLSCEVFDNCVATLTEVVKLLDSLINERILEVVHGQRSPHSSSAVEEDVSDGEFVMPASYLLYPYIPVFQVRPQYHVRFIMLIGRLS